MTQDLFTLTTALHASHINAAAATPDSHPGDQPELSYLETTTGRIKSIREEQGYQTHTDIPHSSHLVPSIVALKLELASEESPAGSVKAQRAGLHQQLLIQWVSHVGLKNGHF